ncbi:hypothetical protein SORBI_3001G182900 [Sorghum bicolor]|uniref:Uncharacterized protein n=1 Tax=Sorghum bicolor TaxID=4558 RepID=A0A1B6QJM5_SORBI|nr:hypothetical protein SORBI_3001G182900 [Sorghum bicolor]
MMKQYINISKQVQSSGNFLMQTELKFGFSLINITMVLLTDYLFFFLSAVWPKRIFHFLTLEYPKKTNGS